MNLIGGKDAAVLETAIRSLRFMDFVLMIFSRGPLVGSAPLSSISTSLWPADPKLPLELSGLYVFWFVPWELKIKTASDSVHPTNQSWVVFPPCCTINAPTKESSCRDNKGHVYTKAVFSETDHFLNRSQKKKEVLCGQSCLQKC